MGLFRKHNADVAERFDEVFAMGRKESEQEFVYSLNEIYDLVAKDKSYKQDEKLKIYSMLSMMENSSAKERPKLAKKLKKMLS